MPLQTLSSHLVAVNSYDDTLRVYDDRSFGPRAAFLPAPAAKELPPFTDDPQMSDGAAQTGEGGGQYERQASARGLSTGSKALVAEEEEEEEAGMREVRALHSLVGHRCVHARCMSTYVWACVRTYARTRHMHIHHGRRACVTANAGIEGTQSARRCMLAPTTLGEARNAVS